MSNKREGKYRPFPAFDLGIWLRGLIWLDNSSRIGIDWHRRVQAGVGGLGSLMCVDNSLFRSNVERCRETGLLGIFRLCRGDIRVRDNAEAVGL